MEVLSLLRQYPLSWRHWNLLSPLGLPFHSIEHTSSVGSIQVAQTPHEPPSVMLASVYIGIKHLSHSPVSLISYIRIHRHPDRSFLYRPFILILFPVVPSCLCCLVHQIRQPFFHIFHRRLQRRCRVI